MLKAGICPAGVTATLIFVSMRTGLGASAGVIAVAVATTVDGACFCASVVLRSSSHFLLEEIPLRQQNSNKAAQCLGLAPELLHLCAQSFAFLLGVSAEQSDIALLPNEEP